MPQNVPGLCHIYGMNICDTMSIFVLKCLPVQIPENEREGERERDARTHNFNMCLSICVRSCYLPDCVSRHLRMHGRCDMFDFCSFQINPFFNVGWKSLEEE